MTKSYLYSFVSSSEKSDYFCWVAFFYCDIRRCKEISYVKRSKRFIKNMKGKEVLLDLNMEIKFKNSPETTLLLLLLFFTYNLISTSLFLHSSEP